ncbi:hypothetical protein AAZX31_11G110200 [Glycine max]
MKSRTILLQYLIVHTRERMFRVITPSLCFAALFERINWIGPIFHFLMRATTFFLLSVFCSGQGCDSHSGTGECLSLSMQKKILACEVRYRTIPARIFVSFVDPN